MAHVTKSLHKTWISVRNGQVLLRLFIYLIMADLALVFLYPFLYLLVTSVKSATDLRDLTVNWVPNTFVFSNFKTAFDLLDYPRTFVNSLILSVVSTAGHVFSCSFVAYGLARFRFFGRRLVFALVVFTIIVPVQVVIIPQYVVFASLKLTNTFAPIILPSLFGLGLRGGLFIFIFRQFFQGLPPALEDAAKIDGCGHMRTYFNIVLPIAKPSIVVTAILSIVWHWNEYFESSIYLGKQSVKPLPAMLPAIYQKFQEMSSSVNIMSKPTVEVTMATVAAATFLVVIPMLLMFLIVQRQFVEGVERTGLVE